MVNARLAFSPMQFNEEQVGGPSGTVDQLEANPIAPADEGTVAQLYRSLARTYAGEIQRHKVRKQRIIAAVVSLGMISFLGLMALGYWGSL